MFDSSIALTIWRVLSNTPPGVSSVMMIRAAFIVSACWISRSRYRSATPSIVRFRCTTDTTGVDMLSVCASEMLDFPICISSGATNPNSPIVSMVIQKARRIDRNALPL